MTRSDYQGLDHWDPITLMENLVHHGKDQLETACLMQHFETGYYDELWVPLMKYQKLIEKYGYPIVPYPRRFQGVDYGFEMSMTEAFKKIPEKDRKLLLGFKKQFLQELNEVIFGVQNDVALKGWCNFCSAK